MENLYRWNDKIDGIFTHTILRANSGCFVVFIDIELSTAPGIATQIDRKFVRLTKEMICELKIMYSNENFETDHLPEWLKENIESIRLIILNYYKLIYKPYLEKLRLQYS